MLNQSDDTSLAWVWSQYRGEQGNVAKASIADGEVSVAAEAVNAVTKPGFAASSTGTQASATTGPLLAALIMVIMGLLWFASTDKKPEAPAVNGAASDVPSGTAAPVSSPSPEVSGQSAVPTPAAPQSTASPAASPSAGEQHPSRHRQRRHH